MSSFQGRLTGLGISFIFLLWANLVTPLWADDYCRIVTGGLREYILLSWRDYFTWSGRFFTTAITYFVLGTGHLVSFAWFDVLNALIFLGLIALVLHLGRLAAGTDGRVQRDFLTEVTDTLVIGLLLWWIPRDIGEVALWKTGSIGYLWPMAGELFVLMRMLPNAGAPSLWLWPIAFLAATFLEPLSVLMSMILAALAIMPRRTGRGASIAVAVAHASGTIFLLAAPGNFARAAIAGPSPISDRIVGVIGNLGSLFDGYWIVAIFILVLPFLIFHDVSRVVAKQTSQSRERPNMETSRRSLHVILKAGHGWVFIVVALVYMLTLLALPRPVLAARVSFPASVFLVCYLASIWQLRPTSSRQNRILLSAIVVLSAVHCTVVIPHLTALARIDRAWSAALKSQAPGSNATLRLVRVDRHIILARKDRFFEGVTADPTDFINVCYAKAMGMRIITAR